jgi:hypothetical protein
MQHLVPNAEGIERGVRLFTFLADAANQGDALGIAYADFIAYLHGAQSFRDLAGREYIREDTTEVLAAALRITAKAGGRKQVTRGGHSIDAGMDSFIWSSRRPFDRPAAAWSGRLRIPYTRLEWLAVFPDDARHLISIARLDEMPGFEKSPGGSGARHEQPEGDAITALQNALLLRPPTEKDKLIIFSINPSAWAKEYRVINIARLLGVRPTTTGRPEDLENDVSLDFQSAGWPLQRIAEQFRPDLKNPGELDIALLAEDGQCLVAVEIKRNSGQEWHRRVRDAWIQLQRLAPTVPWHVVTDGATFVMRNSTTGKHVELQHAFSPESLTSGDFTASATASGDPPASLTELRALVKEARSVVLDYTIPLIRLDPKTTLRMALGQEVSRPLPPVMDLTQGLLAWIAQCDNLAWVSAFGPASLLRGESSQWIRDELASRFAVRTVIEFGNVFRDVHPSMRFCIVHLGKTKGPAYLASITGDSRKELDARVRAATQFLAGENPGTGFIADVKERWAVSVYDPELNKLEERLAGIGPTKPLSELCMVLRGVAMAPHKHSAQQEIPLVTRVTQIETPESLPDDVRKVALTPDTERFLLRPGDVVVPAIRGAYPRCVLVQADVPLVASDRLFILRVTESGITPEFLVEYLNSGLARRLIEERYAGFGGPMILSVRSLGSLPVPILGRPVTLNLRNIGTVEAALRRRADELEVQRQTLFDATSPEAFANAVQDLRRKGELLSRSLLRADDLGFQVANFYPFPIAYGYRLLASISNPTDLYKEQLRVGENILAFLASVAMSLIQPADRASVGLDVRDVWDGGASPGHWREIIGKCCKVLSTYKDHPLSASIVRLHITAEKRAFGAAVQQIIAAKNDFKHDRGPRTEEECDARTKEMQRTLDDCITALAFFTEYPIRQIIDVDVTRTGEVKLRCLTLVGDHPGLPQEEVPYRIALPKRDLYIAAAGVGWVPLFPLLVARNCRTCKTRETFFLDKWNRKKGTAMRKSFERGHEEETNEVIEHMAGPEHSEAVDASAGFQAEYFCKEDSSW